MDEKRFDTMARGMARHSSRRGVPGGVLAAALTLGRDRPPWQSGAGFAEPIAAVVARMRPPPHQTTS